MHTPYLDGMFHSFFMTTEEDSPAWESISGASNELDALKRELEAKTKAYEAASKALYHMQFVQHEELLNKYCEVKKDLKTLLEKMG